MKRVILLVAFLLGAGCDVWAKTTIQEPLAVRQRRGKQIYIQGTSSSGKGILAYVGEPAMEMPGNAMPCANCHGLDGQGKPEGGISPSNITWDALTKPYGIKHSDGRQHPAYTVRGLELAITRGIDPAGNKLQNVMPRYVMSREDLADLVVYLERLGKDRDPGISEDKIIIGSAGPTTSALAEMGEAVKAVTSAFFDELNSQGGIYSRKLELRFVGTPATGESTASNVQRLLADEQVFAMTGAFIAGAEKEIIPLLVEKDVPLIGPFTLYPQTEFPLNRQIFYVLTGIDGQSRALIDFAAKNAQFKNPRLAVVYPQNANTLKVLDAIKGQVKKNGLSEPRTYGYASGQFDVLGATKQLKQNDSDVIFLLGSGEEVMSFLREADKANWFPFIFSPSTIAGANIFTAPAGFKGRIFFSLPTAPPDHTQEGLKAFRALATKYKLPDRHVGAQISAYTAAKILVEALKRAGKDLSRERLINALEGFYEYPTGLTQAITYGPNRRIGALGAYIVTIDLEQKQYLPVGGWIDIN